MPRSGIEVRCVAVGTVIVDLAPSPPRILLVRRAAGPLRGHWSLVTGWIERGETAWQAAQREVAEEVGITDARWYSAGYTDRFYNVRADIVEMVPIFVAVVGPGGSVRLNDENDAFRWVQAADASALIPFKGHRDAIAEVAGQFFMKSPPDWLALSTYEDL